MRPPAALSGWWPHRRRSRRHRVPRSPARGAARRRRAAAAPPYSRKIVPSSVAEQPNVGTERFGHVEAGGRTWARREDGTVVRGGRSLLRVRRHLIQGSDEPGSSLRCMTATNEGVDIHTTAGKLADLRPALDEAVHAGSARAVEKQHARGKMTARERIDAAARRGLVRRARRARPAPVDHLRHGEEPPVRRRRGHRLRHRRRPPGLRLRPGLHRLRRLARARSSARRSSR